MIMKRFLYECIPFLCFLSLTTTTTTTTTVSAQYQPCDWCSNEPGAIFNPSLVVDLTGIGLVIPSATCQQILDAGVDGLLTLDECFRISQTEDGRIVQVSCGCLLPESTLAPIASPINVISRAPAQPAALIPTQVPVLPTTPSPIIGTVAPSTATPSTIAPSPLVVVQPEPTTMTFPVITPLPTSIAPTTVFPTFTVQVPTTPSPVLGLPTSPNPTLSPGAVLSPTTAPSVRKIVTSNKPSRLPGSVRIPTASSVRTPTTRSLVRNLSSSSREISEKDNSYVRP